MIERLRRRLLRMWLALATFGYAPGFTKTARQIHQLDETPERTCSAYRSLSE